MVYNKGVWIFKGCFQSEGKVLGASWRFTYQETSRRTDSILTYLTEKFGSFKKGFPKETTKVNFTRVELTTAVRGSCSAPPWGGKTSGVSTGLLKVSCLVTSSVLLARGFTRYWDGGSEISRTTGNTERNIGANGNPGFPMSYPRGQNWLLLKVVEHSSTNS